MAVPCSCAAILRAALERTLADPPKSAVLSAPQFLRIVDANSRDTFLKLQLSLARMGICPVALETMASPMDRQGERERRSHKQRDVHHRRRFAANTSMRAIDTSCCAAA
jgi:hypothetical protein